MTENSNFPSTVIGQKIRNVRKEKGLTIEELAQKIEVSQSMVSQIERGQANPSLDTLWKVSHVLGTPIFSFFENIEHRSVQVIKKEQQKTVKMLHPNVVYRLLTRSSSLRKIEFFELQVEPFHTGNLKQLAHSGEECGYIMKGEIVVAVEHEKHHLKVGDSIYFDSTLPHSFFNPGNETAIAIWAMTGKK